MISQTSGHADFRSIWELPGYEGKLSRADVLGAAALADGPDAVLRATREQLMQGASQIKIVAGGGAASAYDPVRLAKQMIVWEGTDNAYKLAQKYNILTGFGTDVLFDAPAATRQGKVLAYMKRWYTPAQALKQATADSAAILELSGPRNPYTGQLGVIQKGAYADMILVDGDPTENLDLVADAETNFRITMKAGEIYKNTLA